MIIGNHPGPWHLFVNRPDNKGQHIMVVRNKYLQEQVNYENQLSQTIQMQNMLSLQPKGRGSRVEDNTVNEYVEDDYVEDYLI